MSSILEICQDVASLVATQPPQNLFNTDSQQEAIFLSIANDTLDSLRRFGDWQELTKEGMLETHPLKKRYYIGDVAPDFFALINNTMTVRDTKNTVIGAISPESFVKERLFKTACNTVSFKIQNNCFQFLNLPKEPVRISFFYRSAVVVFDPKAPEEEAEKVRISANTDIPVFDEYIVKLGIMWRWYKRNGMPYEEEYQEYQKEVKKRFASSLSLKDISLVAPQDMLFNGGVHVCLSN